MNIKLTDIEIRFLKQYAEVYEKERKVDCTNRPIVVVEVQRDIVVDSDYGYDEIRYIWDDETYDGEDELREFLEENDFSESEVEEVFFELQEYGEALKGNIRKVYVNIEWFPVAYFLTRVEAEEYCKYQRHNLNNPRVYSRNIGYRNSGDLDCFVNLLLRMGTEILKEEE